DDRCGAPGDRFRGNRNRNRSLAFGPAGAARRSAVQMTWVVCSIFVIWLALSIANQVPITRNRLTATLNSFGVLPAFSLFAPEPVDVDYHLVWRDLTSEGTYGDWRELIFAPSTRGRAVWNPGGRDLSAMIQVVSDLSILASAFAPSSRSGHR